MNMIAKSVVSSVIVSTVVLLNVAGCTRPSAPVSETQSAASPAPALKNITTADLAKLRWIEGTWRGTGETQPPFFERYHFENDSTLIVEGLADETLSKVTDVTRFELKDGQFINDSAPPSVAIELDDKSVTFGPVAKGRNTFRFQTESKDVWKAILKNPGSGTTPAKEVIYTMVRFPAAKN